MSLVYFGTLAGVIQQALSTVVEGVGSATGTGTASAVGISLSIVIGTGAAAGSGSASAISEVPPKAGLRTIFERRRRRQGTTTQ